MADPFPLEAASVYTPFEWQITDEVQLKAEKTRINVNLAQVLASRRSTRVFPYLSIQRLGDLLWHTCRVLESSPSSYGFELLKCPYPSAGAIHPIQLLLFHSDMLLWTRYNALTHSLEVIHPQAPLDGLRQRFCEFMPIGDGTLVVFVAELGLTSSKYAHPDSLIWRDAGVLQGTLALVAHALNIGLCLLGGTGDPWVSNLSEETRLMGVGMAILGGGAS